MVVLALLGRICTYIQECTCHLHCNAGTCTVWGVVLDAIVVHGAGSGMSELMALKIQQRQRQGQGVDGSCNRLEEGTTYKHTVEEETRQRLTLCTVRSRSGRAQCSSVCRNS